MLSAGFTLIGSDVKLNSPSSLVGQALTEILQHPERARDALRVLLHLVRAGGAPGELGRGAGERRLRISGDPRSQQTSLPESFPGFREGLIIPLASPSVHEA